MTIAQAIHAALGGTQKQTAALVGEPRSHWCGYIHGNRSPTEGKILAWLDVLAANGRPVSVCLDSTGRVIVL